MKPYPDLEFDLVVLGGGPAGASAATSAHFLGNRAALLNPAGVQGGADTDSRHTNPDSPTMSLKS